MEVDWALRAEKYTSPLDFKFLHETFDGRYITVKFPIHLYQLDGHKH